VRVNDPQGPDQTAGTLDDDDGTPPADDKAMRDPAIAAAIVNNCPVLVSAFSDHSLRGTGSPSELFSVGFARSTNLGASWLVNGIHTHNIARQNLDPPPGTPWGGWLPEQKHPSVAAGGNGRLYAVGYDFREMNQSQSITSLATLWLARSSDQGSSWTTVEFALPPHPSKRIMYRYPSIIADPSDLDVYLTWTRQDNGLPGTSVWFAASSDGGVTFSTPVRISGFLVQSEDLVVSTVALGLDGAVYVVWFEPKAYTEIPTDRYVLRRSTDGGMNFDPEVEVVRIQGLSTSEALFCNVSRVSVFDPCHLVRPSLAVDTSLRTTCLGREQWLYMAYAHDARTLPNPGGGFIADANVYVVVSRDGGDTWEQPRAVHDLNPRPLGHDPEPFGSPSQYLPAIAVSDAGHVGVSFLNAVDDVLGDPDTPAIANQAYKVYFTYSVDGGCTFVPEFVVEDTYSLPRVADDPNHPHYFDVVGMTEYVGLTAYGRTFQPVWMSLRNWVGPPDPQRPDNWRQLRETTTDYVGDIYTVRVEVLDGAAPDLDSDCDVDIQDFTIFQLCFGGSNNPPAPTCPAGVDADMDPVPCGDGDVDLADFLLFQQCFTGSFTGCIGAGGTCSDGSSEGGMAPEFFGPEPSPEQLRQMLEDWCRANGIPFT